MLGCAGAVGWFAFGVLVGSMDVVEYDRCFSVEVLCRAGSIKAGRRCLGGSRRD